MVKGWVVDVYPDEKQDKMVIWIKTSKENIKMVEEFYPAFYIHSSRAELESLKKRYQDNNWIREIEFCRAKLGFYSSDEEVLKITVKHYKALNALAREIDAFGDYEYRFFNVDLSLAQRYFFEKNIFPMAYIKLNGNFELLDSEYSRDYQIPDLKSIELGIEIARKGRIPRYSDRLSKVYIYGEEKIVLESKDEAALLLELNKCIKNLDPDIIYTQHGDSFILPFLYHRGLENNIKINLGRELDSYTPSRGERSYFSYGRIMYKPASYLLKGRMHIDVENSFLYQESGLEGLILLSRLSRIPLQKLARASPGTAISSMQLLQTYRDGVLIEWKKNKPEKFKTAAKLLLSDRGGFIYEPRVGIFNNVAEIDFSSLYPNIMLHKNISPETVLCECCEVENNNRVPVLNYHICTKRIGLIPRVLKPVLEMRRDYKENASASKVCDQRQRALKWILVTCFGYTGYRNAKFGRIECHESITAFGREIFLDASSIAEENGYEVLHGIVDSLWIRKLSTSEISMEDCQMLCLEISKATGIPIELEGIYKWIVFLPCRESEVGALNRYYGLFESGELKVRGIELRRRDSPNLIKNLQRDMLAVFSRASNFEEFKELIPRAIGILRAYAEDLLSGRVDPQDLVFLKTISKDLDFYLQENASKVVLKQLRREGVELKPGQSIKYILTDNRKVSAGAKPAELLEGDEVINKEKYLEYLLKAGESLLIPFGYSKEKLKGSIFT